MLSLGKGNSNSNFLSIKIPLAPMPLPSVFLYLILSCRYLIFIVRIEKNLEVSGKEEMKDRLLDQLRQ